MHFLSGLLLASALAGPGATQSPPIFNPGAPGSAARIITPNEALALSRTTFTEGDVRFMQHMIMHHAQAVQMVELLEDHGRSPTVRLLGERIARSQTSEIELMRGWLADRNQPADMPHDHAAMEHAEHADMAPMPGMLKPSQMRALSEARGGAFDRLFLTGMIQHHQGALDMVDDLMAQPNAAQDPTLSDFATSVVADQSAEILRMQSVLSEL